MDEGRAPPADVAEAAVPQGTMSDYCLPHLNSVSQCVTRGDNIIYFISRLTIWEKFATHIHE